MDKSEIIKSLGKKGNGEIYLYYINIKKAIN